MHRRRDRGRAPGPFQAPAAAAAPSSAAQPRNPLMAWAEQVWARAWPRALRQQWAGTQWFVAVLGSLRARPNPPLERGGAQPRRRTLASSSSGCLRIRYPSRDLCCGGGASARIGEHEIADGNKIRPGASERFHLVQRAGKPEAGKLKQLGPPCHSFQDGLQRWAPAGAVRLAEHDVIRAQLARDHGIVPGREPPATSDTIRLEAGKRRLQRFHSAEMGTVGSRTYRKLGISVEEESNPLFLHPRSERLDVI